MRLAWCHEPKNNKDLWCFDLFSGQGAVHKFWRAAPSFLQDIHKSLVYAAHVRLPKLQSVELSGNHLDHLIHIWCLSTCTKGSLWCGRSPGTWFVHWVGSLHVIYLHISCWFFKISGLDFPWHFATHCGCGEGGSWWWALRARALFSLTKGLQNVQRKNHTATHRFRTCFWGMCNMSQLQVWQHACATCLYNVYMHVRNVKICSTEADVSVLDTGTDCYS